MDLRDVVFDSIHRLIGSDGNITILTNDMGALGLERIRKEYPRQVINMGVAEQNIISVAAGMSLAGKTVFAYGIMAHMTRRCYDQICLDVAAMGLPVIILAVGSGLSYGTDGPTHHSNNDIAIMRAIPGLSIYNPSDPISADAVVKLAYGSQRPAYIRIDREQVEALYPPQTSFEEGLARVVDGDSLTIISTGILVHRAVEVSKLLKEKGISARVVDYYRIKPLNEGILRRFVRDSKAIATLEEHSEIGGISGVVAEAIAESGRSVPLKRYALRDEFYYGASSRNLVHSKLGMTTDRIVSDLVDMIIGGRKSV